MADYRSIATVASAVLRHLQDFSASVPQPAPAVLCQPAELATSQGIAICLWRVVAVQRNDIPPARDPSGSTVSPLAAFDLHFLGTSAAQNSMVSAISRSDGSGGQIQVPREA